MSILFLKLQCMQSWVWPENEVLNKKAAWFSYVKEQPAGFLDNIFNTAQEENCLSSINQPMVIRKSDVHHWPWDNITTNNHGTLHYWVHTQDGRLQKNAYQLDFHLPKLPQKSNNMKNKIKKNQQNSDETAT